MPPSPQRRRAANRLTVIKLALQLLERRTAPPEADRRLLHTALSATDELGREALLIQNVPAPERIPARHPGRGSWRRRLLRLAWSSGRRTLLGFGGRVLGGSAIGIKTSKHRREPPPTGRG